MGFPGAVDALGVSLGTLASTVAILFNRVKVIAGVLWIPIYNVFFHPLRAYPGPWWLGATRIPWFLIVYGAEAPQQILELHREYGEVVRIAPDELSYVDPQAWKDVAGHRKTAQGENPKDPAFFRGAVKSLVGAPKDRHTLMRKALASGFSTQAVAQQQPYLMKYIDLLIQQLRAQCDGGRGRVDMVAWLNWTTFDIIGDLTFGEPFQCLETASYHPWVAFVFERIRMYIVHSIICRLPIPANMMESILPQSVKEKGARHVKFATERVRQRLAVKDPRPDFLESLKNQDEITFQETCVIAASLIGAGSETTAAILAGALYFIAKHQEVEAKVVEEVRAAFKNEDEIDIYSVQKLPYMLAVIDETLRMYPAVPWGMPRVAQQGGDTICGRYVPEGTILGVWHYAINRYPGNFTQPDFFIPERWLGDARFAKDRKDACQPFSYGPRNCIGINLAHAEMRLMLARFIWNFDIELADDSKHWYPRKDHAAYVSWKKPPLNMFITPRNNSI
ncbi:cytochrome P450 [Thozetella sp. PMI_491]|nr:cytochrome P450 [Thozetella sp. PMI_491]